MKEKKVTFKRNDRQMNHLIEFDMFVKFDSFVHFRKSKYILLKAQNILKIINENFNCSFSPLSMTLQIDTIKLIEFIQLFLFFVANQTKTKLYKPTDIHA